MANVSAPIEFIQVRLTAFKQQAGAVKDQTSAVCFPKKYSVFHFPSAISAIDHQRISRIAKTAIFIFANLALTALILLTEATVVAWPITLPVIAITLLFWGIFYQLNRHDETHVSSLADSTRAALAKIEIENVVKDPSSHKNPLKIERTLTDVNKLLGYPVFSKPYIQKFIDERNQNKKPSLMPAAPLPDNPLKINCDQKWQEKGRYGNSTMNYSLKVVWSGKKEDALEVAFSRIVDEPKGKENPIVPPVEDKKDVK